MKRLYTLFAILAIAIALQGCGTPKLAAGGVYAPAGQVADLQLYQADVAYSLAFGTLDSAFRFERENRTTLWKLSPQIKKSLDAIRPDAWQANQHWAVARQAYITSPVPANLTAIQVIVAKVQQLAVTAQAALSKGN